MNLQSATGIDHAGIKLGSAWASVLIAKLGFASWSELAAFAALLYTGCLLAEWWWKKMVRPLLENYGVLKRKLRRKDDA